MTTVDKKDFFFIVLNNTSCCFNALKIFKKYFFEFLQIGTQ